MNASRAVGENPVSDDATNASASEHNANARHPDVLAAQRKERARIRSEKGIRREAEPLSLRDRATQRAFLVRASEAPLRPRFQVAMPW